MPSDPANYAIQNYVSTNNDTNERKEPLLIKNAILSYPKLTKAEKARGDADSKPRFGAELRIPKSDTEGHKAIMERINEIKKEKEKGKVKIYDSNLCIKDGDTWEKRKPEHAGFWILSSNRAEKQGPPPAYGKKASAGALTVEETDKLFYPGCRVNVKVGFFFSDIGGAKICSSLELIQFAGDGERLGGSGGHASADDLPDIEDEEDDQYAMG